MKGRGKNLTLAIIALAFFLQTFSLARPSLWHDEGISVYIASKGVREILRETGATDHPPLYFLLLHFWLGLAGKSEFSVRFFSVFWGVISIALLYPLGLRIFGVGNAQLAMFLLASSPFFVRYAQEARGYTLWVALILASFYFLGRGWKENAPRFWLAYSLSALATLYTHFFSAFALAAQAAYVSFRLLLRADGRLFPWPKRAITFSFLSVALGFLPWIPCLIYQVKFNATYWPGTLNLGKALREWLRAFAVGETLSGPWARAGEILFLAFIVVGIVAAFANFRKQKHRFFIAFYPAFALATFALLLFSFALNHPKYHPRYLLPTLPLALLLFSNGVDFLKGKASYLPYPFFLAFLWANLLSLQNYYLNPAFSRDDFRLVVDYINRNAQPGDGVILVGGHFFPVFEYYNRTGLPFYPATPGILPRVDKPITSWEAAMLLNEVAFRHRRVWLVLWQEELADPRHIFADLLTTYAQRLPVHLKVDRGPALLLFSLENSRHFFPTPPITHPSHAQFEDNLKLLGYDLGGSGWVRYHHDERASFRRGETIYLTLYWEANGPVSRNYVAFTHLLDGEGKLRSGMDKLLGEGYYPTSRWIPGEVYWQDYPLPIPSELPEGRYWIEVGLYDLRTMERLQVLGEAGHPQGDRILLGPVEITP
jgi:hypothetical protein